MLVSHRSDVMPLSPIRFGTFDWPHWDEDGKEQGQVGELKGDARWERKQGVDCSKDKERFVENKTRQDRNAHGRLMLAA